MPTPVYLPKFDPQHAESQILNWAVAEGDSVLAGDVLCEVETDKVNMEVEAPADGALAAVRYPVGTVAPAASIIAYVLLEGESAADIPPEQPLAQKQAEPAQPTPRVSPIAQRLAAEQNVDLTTIVGSGPGGRITRRDVEAQTTISTAKVRATPAARRLARLNDLDLATLSGSGPRGRIQATDVPVAPATNGAQTVQLTGMRQRIAQRLQQSYQTAPHIFVEMPVDMSQVEVMRQDAKAAGKPVSVTTVLIKACAWALQRHPRLNATLTDDVFTIQPTVNLGIAVALDEGLIVPVLHDAATLGLGDIQTRSSDLIERARTGELKRDEVVGGTFTISNLGMFGVSRFTAIINPPQVAILAVGGITRQFVPDKNDQPVVRPMMNLVLSVDHRVIDGADAARFLDDLRQALEQPLRLLW